MASGIPAAAYQKKPGAPGVQGVSTGPMRGRMGASGAGYRGGGPMPASVLGSARGGPVAAAAAPGVPPGAGGGGGQSYTQNVQANPYLAQAFQHYGDLLAQSKELYGKALDPTAAIQDYQDMRAQGLKELQAQSGASGFGPGTGMSLARSQDYLMRGQQGEQELAADWRNRGLQFQKDILGQMGGLLGGMTGAGGAIAGNQLGLGQLGVEQAKLGLDSWYKQNMLPIEMERAKSGLLNSQISAMSQLAGML